jgi:chromodomain-helicase-DNA-binding protein 4
MDSDVINDTESNTNGVNSDDDEDDEDYSEDSDMLIARRTTRAMTQFANKKKPVKPLPFSPKKTRFRKMFIVGDSDDDLELSSADGGVVRRPARRSTRTRNMIRTYDAGEDDFVPEDDAHDDSDRVPVRKGKARPKKQTIRRAAYGHIRSVDDLGYDSHSDTETAPLRVHRSLCEKCHREPTHKLLEARKKKPRAKKKKRELDEFEDSGTDDEKILALGGWVRWCVMSSFLFDLYFLLTIISLAKASNARS